MLHLKIELDGKVEHFKALQGARRALMEDFRRVQEERSRIKAGHELLRDPEAINVSMEEVDDRLEEARKEIERLKTALFDKSNRHAAESHILGDLDIRDQLPQ